MEPNSTTTTKKPSACLQNMDEVTKIFNRFDANGDGKISASELADVLKALGSDSSADEVKRMMDDLDTDRDGYINLAEFASFCRKDSSSSGTGGDESSSGNDLRDAFELYDKDKNGLISADELHLVLTRLGESCSVQDCSRMIESVDSDGDGNVSFEEFKTMMMNSSSMKKVE